MVTSFETFKKEMFFKPQEILFGKSLCDINLNEESEIKSALANFDESNSFDSGLKSTLLGEILYNDPKKV